MSDNPVDPWKLPLRFVTLGNTWKKPHKFLSPRKQLFSEMIVSIDLLGHTEMNLSFAKFLSKHLVGPYNLFAEVCQTRYLTTREKNAKINCHGKIAFFEMFVSNDILGPYEINLRLAQYLSNYLVCPSIFFRDFCHVR